MDTMAAIELALKNEKTEMEFYQHEASRSRNPLAKAMFLQLAKDEEEHMTRIRGVHQKRSADGSWPKDVPIQVKGTHVTRVLEETVKKTGSAQDHDGDDQVALKKAIEFESRGHRFYVEVAAGCSNPMEQKFFRFLAEIEREHHLSLVDSLAYLEDPEGWTRQHERSGLDGA